MSLLGTTAVRYLLWEPARGLAFGCSFFLPCLTHSSSSLLAGVTSPLNPLYPRSCLRFCCHRKLKLIQAFCTNLCSENNCTVETPTPLLTHCNVSCKDARNKTSRQFFLGDGDAILSEHKSDINLHTTSVHSHHGWVSFPGSTN